MKLDKNKVVFAGIMIFITLCIGVYATMVMGDDEAPNMDTNQIPVPKLEDEQKVYESKLDALNDLKEVKQTNAPSIYDERLLDSMGVYDPDLLDKEKMRIVDSIYRNGRLKYSDSYGFRDDSRPKINIIDQTIKTEKDTIPKTLKSEVKSNIDTKELVLEHRLFFASNPTEDPTLKSKNTDDLIYVRVDGTQTVKTNYRLRMRLSQDAIINDVRNPRNTLIYGFVSFQPNRTIIEIENINHYPTKLKAYDMQDGSEGIYIENSFRADATREVLEDAVQDFNIAGVPQVGGVKKIFQRNNRNIKVTVLNNYQLILKAHNGH